jgi:hypothetical protein
MIAGRRAARACACAFGAAFALLTTGAAPGAEPSPAPTLEAPPRATSTTNIQDVPAVVQFRNRDVYRGDVRLEYGSRAALPATADATVSFADKKARRSGYVAVPNGRGTFTSRSGLLFTDTSFVDGRAYGRGTLTVPDAQGSAVKSFEGIFVAGSPFYGTVAYADGATYTGYFADGCFAAAPLAPPAAPADAPPGVDLFAGLPATPVDDVFAGTDGMRVSGTWRHPPGAPCSESSVSRAQVTYDGGDAYFGDLTPDGRYTGFGAFYAHGATNDVLLCGSRPETALYGPGEYTATIGRFAPLGSDADAVCHARRDDVTTMTIVVSRLESKLDGVAAVVFSNGDRADGQVRAGVLSGSGHYRPASFAATIGGTFADGHLGGTATLTDACGRSYAVTVQDGIVRNAGGRVAYLFHACDFVVLGPGATLAAGAAPNGRATEHLTGGETIDALWHGGFPSGRVIVHVRRPYAAVIEIANARDAGHRISGAATIRFANGDVARGRLDAPLAAVSALEGRGEYTFASTGCIARGTFHNGRLRGPATLTCPNEAPYVGVAGNDGTVQ